MCMDTGANLKTFTFDLCADMHYTASVELILHFAISYAA